MLLGVARIDRHKRVWPILAASGPHQSIATVTPPLTPPPSPLGAPCTPACASTHVHAQTQAARPSLHPQNGAVGGACTQQQRRWLNIHETDSCDVMRKHGINVANGARATTPEEAAKVFDSLGLLRLPAQGRCYIALGGHTCAPPVTHAYAFTDMHACSHTLSRILAQLLQLNCMLSTPCRSLPLPPRFTPHWPGLSQLCGVLCGVVHVHLYDSGCI